MNGDPDVDLPLDEVGEQQGLSLAGAGWVPTILTCVTSRFPRARQTADLLLGQHWPERVLDHRLDEIDYGEFEGGPWMRYGDWLDAHGRHVRPPGSRESLHEASSRYLAGLNAALATPGPRLVVGHGLMYSILAAARDDHRGLGHVLRLPEAPYATPLVLDEEELAALLDALRQEFAEAAPSRRAGGGL